MGRSPGQSRRKVKGAASGGFYLDSESTEERSEEMIETKLLGPAPGQYAVLSDESGAWVATCYGEHAEAVKAAIEEEIAKAEQPKLSD